MQVIKSAIKNPHDMGINDEIAPDIRPVPIKNKYRFFSTGSSEMLMKGIDVDLKMDYNPKQCKEYLMSQLQKKIDVRNMDLIIYLAGGIPFLGGTLGDIYSEQSVIQVRPYIYGILTRKVPDEYLNEIHYCLCNVANEKQKLLLSPLCDSSLQGLCDIACLLGYLNNDGTKNDDFLRAFAATVRFPPLITCLHRVIDRNDITGRDIITICSTLYTFFRYLIKAVITPDKIFEYGLRCCNMIVHIKNIPENLPIRTFELQPDDTNTAIQFLRKLNQPQTSYFWTNDSGTRFNFVELDPLEPQAIENANKGFASFTPIPPLSAKNLSGCSIIRGLENSCLYISASTLKGIENQNIVDIIDPVVGAAATFDIEDYAKKIENGTTEKVATLIDPEKVQQIIFVCFDASESMEWPMTGKKDKDKVTKLGVNSRFFIATQYLTTFANKTYAYRIPCLLGLIPFNMSVEVKCPLSPLLPDFENQGLKKIKCFGKTHLWEALSLACDEIIKCTTATEFPNAIKRIIVISDGEDDGSNINFLEVTKKLLKNQIIVDSIIISLRDDCKELAVLSHVTSGIAFVAKDVLRGLHLIEESAFLNYKERKPPYAPLIKGDAKMKPSLIKVPDITEKFLKQAVAEVTFDEKTHSKLMSKIGGNPNLATPEYVCYVNQNEEIPQSRRRRILRELLNAAKVMKDDPNNDRYDRDLMIYPLSSNCDIWEVFIKAPDDTPYLGKWFKLIVTFPELYPVEAPIFRFVSIPYHLNVSSEGRICLDIIEKGYISSKPVVEIIQEIKQLFLFPCEETPTQLEIHDVYIEEKTKDEYYRRASESAKKVGKDDYKEFFPPKVYINKDVDPNYKIDFSSGNVPMYMRSVISDRKYVDPVMVPEINQVYERKELKQIVSSHINPVCQITGRPIKLTIGQIDALDTYDFTPKPEKKKEGEDDKKEGEDDKKEGEDDKKEGEDDKKEGEDDEKEGEA